MDIIKQKHRCRSSLIEAGFYQINLHSDSELWHKGKLIVTLGEFAWEVDCSDEWNEVGGYADLYNFEAAIIAGKVE